MQRFTHPDDVGEALEELWSALVGKFCHGKLWKARRFHVFTYAQYPTDEDKRFEHMLAAGGL